MDSLTYLTKKISHLGEQILIDDLLPNEREDLQTYMKKKRMKFFIYGKHLVVTSMTSNNITHLFRYFMLGTKTKEISIHLLYDCWDEKDKYDFLYFQNMLEKHLKTTDFEYFDFQGKLIFKNT